MKYKQAVILCGGRGERLKPLTNKIPKPMVSIEGKPFLYYLLRQLSNKQIKNFILLTGYKGNKIKSYFKDGKKFGWNINYSNGLTEWNTGKRIYEAKKFLKNDFILLYSDNYINLNIDNLFNKHQSHNYPITMTLVKKNNGNISLNKKLNIDSYSPKKTKDNLNYVELGYMIINKKQIFERFFKKEPKVNFNFSKVLETSAKKKQLGNVLVENVYYSISDPERFKITSNFLKKKKILLIDRDGIINEKANKAKYIESWKDFRFINKNIEGLKLLSKQGFKFIIITNQACIAQNIITRNKLNYIHRKMKSELLKDGIEILKVYFSPDHYNNNKSKTRKPAPGMFFSASKDFKLNLDDCLYVGDDIRDCIASYNAGFKSVFIGKKNSIKTLNKKQYPVFVSKDITNSVKFILDYYNEK